MTLLDLSLLDHYMESLGEAVIKQMLALYNQQSENYLTDISMAISDQSQEDWKAACHKMKGAAGSTGLIQLNKFLAEKEKSIDEWSVKQNYLLDLRDLNKKSVEAFSNWLTSSTKK